ncbi:MAG: hypothetical protein JHC81_05000 [Brevundimonas sp.]|uniref:hypothetical protein n=1 Tax=Brevundimonas sp. TaxID=1871086 RepID=UPI001A1F6746|nr:hypothetical protein [Brevundimonas sp.]MBJ7446873.1 hypothetical protein [Brevundimonas sp.]
MSGSTCHNKSRGRAAVLGAALGLTLVFAGVVGVYLYEADVSSAVLWGAIGLANLVAVVIPLTLRRR